MDEMIKIKNVKIVSKNFSGFLEDFYEDCSHYIKWGSRKIGAHRKACVIFKDKKIADKLKILGVNVRAIQMESPLYILELVIKNDYIPDIAFKKTNTNQSNTVINSLSLLSDVSKCALVDIMDTNGFNNEVTIHVQKYRYFKKTITNAVLDRVLVSVKSKINFSDLLAYLVRVDIENERYKDDDDIPEFKTIDEIDSDLRRDD